MTNKKQKQLSLFTTDQLCKKINLNTKLNTLSDIAIENLLTKLHLVSSKQLAVILSKKNDDSLRVARCENRGFPWYKYEGAVYYNLPEVMRKIKVGLNA
tara:strand:+ start:365 stop:661 length:297 start_codon:yes stop_codon:yes gene_type:complete